MRRRAVIFACLGISGYGLFRLGVSSGLPWYIAMLWRTGIALIPLAATAHARDVIADGDSAVFWYPFVGCVTAFVIWLQIASADLVGWPLWLGVGMAACFATAVILMVTGIRSPVKSAV